MSATHKIAIMMLGLAAASAPASADPVADFYKGKKLTIVVGYGAGGGYDTSTRLLARHYGNYIPGKPGVVVQNMTGAGSLVGANYIYNSAPKDGSTIGVFSSTIALLPVYGDKKAKFETMKFSWIGSIDQDVMACAVWKGAGQGIKTLPDLIKAKETVVFGSDGADAPLTRWPMFMKNMLGANLKVVPGYKGTRAINFAMKKGEVNASCGMFESSVRGAYAQDYKSGDLNIFVQGGLKNVPFFGNATNLYSMMKTEDDKKVARLVWQPAELTRPVAGPPGIPKDRLEALRKGLIDAANSPGFRAEAKKLNIDFNPLSGEGIEKALKELSETPPALVKKALEVTQKK
ncbi:MAG: Bug family tripartite tricarboxylate transporter substrate binding protein [Beijerinckiaceae bacterium]